MKIPTNISTYINFSSINAGLAAHSQYKELFNKTLTVDCYITITSISIFHTQIFIDNLENELITSSDLNACFICVSFKNFAIGNTLLPVYIIMK